MDINELPTLSRTESGLRTDISKLNQVEDLQHQYEQIVSASPDLISIIGRDYRYKTVNHTYTRAHLLPQEEIIGRTAAHLFGDKIFEHVLKPRLDACLSGESHSLATWVDYPGFGRCYMDINYYPIRDGNGHIEGIVGSARDITRRREAEDALQEIEEQSRLALWAAKAGTWSWKLGTEKVAWSDENFRLLGYEPGTVEPSYKTWLNCVHPDERGRVEKVLGNALKSDGAFEIEYRIVRPDGEIRWVEADARVCHDVAGKDDIMYGILVDATERRKSEELASRLGRIVEETLNEIYVFDSKSLKFLMVNHGARSNLGFTDAEMKLLTPIDIEPQFTREQFEGLLEPLRTGNLPRLSFETTHQRKDGSTYDVKIHLQYMHLEEPAVFTVIAEDISRDKQVRQELYQAQKMEAVGQLTGGIAHDFNNLLAIILASVELAIEDLGEEDSKSLLLNRALRAIERGETLTKRLLTFSRKQPMQPRTINANEFVANTTDMLKRTIPETVDIQSKLDKALWPTKIDPNLLEDALLNMAINARDALPDGGVLTILTKNQIHVPDTHPEMPAANYGRFVRISVTDNGVGMSAKTLDRVFEPFFTTKDVGAGTGLGLSMVYGFAEQSGGHVTIESEEGEGTTVSICLPAAADVSVSQSTPKADNLPKGNEEIVLIVEDNPNVQEVTAAMLDSLGYQAINAANAQEALNILRANSSIDLLLSDVVLPGGMSGIDLQHEAKIQQPDIKCILMSGYTEISHAELPAELLLLNKPVKREEFANSLHTALLSKPKDVQFS